MNQWIETHRSLDEAENLQEKTEVLELPHGSLVRSTVIQLGKLGNRATVALTFVPGLKVERHADMVEFKYKP